MAGRETVTLRLLLPPLDHLPPGPGDGAGVVLHQHPPQHVHRRPLLQEALDLSLAARSTPFVTLCLAGYAQLAFADGDPDRAALLEGAAEGLRRRVGLRAWPHLRRAEADLVAQVRQRLGAARFDQAFSAGSGLTQQQAVAIVRDQRGTGTQTP